MDSEITQSAAIAELTAAALKERHADEDGSPYVITPNGWKVHSLEELLPVPERIKKETTFVALESFLRYVSSFKQVGTAVYLQADGNARAVLDGHSLGEPRWGDHKADFRVTYSERWILWSQKNKVKMSQTTFAEFIEDNVACIFTPKAADFLEIAQTLEAEQNSTFKSAIRLGKSDVQLTYEKTTSGKAGQRGELEIPTLFQITCPILEAESPRIIDLRLRYELDDGKLTFSFEILRRAALLDEVRRSIYATIKNETSLDPYLVA